MDNEEDEDVVFEGSELHKHFENVGVDSADYLCVIRPDRPRSEETENKLDDNFPSENSRRTFTIIKGFENPFRKKSLAHLELPCYKNYFKTLAESDVLTQDDATFLENYLINEKSGETVKELPFPSDCYKLLAVGALLAACFYNSYCQFQNVTDIFTICCIFTLLLAIYVLNESRRFWDYYVTKKIHQQNQKCLNTLLENCSNFIKLLQKCILIIQEFELVDRGFTLLLPQMSFPHTESPSKSSRHHCPGLRHLTFISSRKIALVFRDATTKLRDNLKLNTGIDHESHYLSSVPVEEFGFHFSDDIEGFDVDPLSISALKSTWQLTCLQISEYFRRLSLSFCIELHNETFIQMDLFRSLSKLLIPLDRSVSSVLLLLQQSYQFHKNAVITEASEKSNKNRILPQSTLKGVKVAVHSLSLHLQSALSRTLDIEKQLENEDIINSTTINNSETKEMLEHLLQTVKMELGACQTCGDEGQKQLDILFNKNSSVPKYSITLESLEQEPLMVNEKNPIPLFEMGDPISEDQIFEAYISDNESQISDNEDDYFVQRDDRKKQKETTKLMLSELQTILTVRADDWKKREKKALAKAKGLDTDSLTSADEDDDFELTKYNGETSVSENRNFEVTQIFKMEKNENNIFELENCEDPTKELTDDIRKEIKRRLQDYSHAPQLDFTASVAALAASRSREMNCIATETFSDSEVEENFSDSNI